MRLPEKLRQFFDSLREKTIFVTSLDRSIAAIYPIAIWRQNEEFFYNYRDDPNAAADIIFNAMDLGAETDVDGQGRIGFSPELRRALGLEDKPLKIFSHKGRIEVLTEEIYEKRKERASQSPEEKLQKLEAAGLR